jgi:regulator of sigma E protease
VFGILVFVHEFGHFFMAKLVGVKVEVFSFGYGKRLFGFKKGDTDYRVSMIPMGGYVKFPGEDVLEKKRELEPGDFMAAKRWQRFLVLIMGSLMNIVLAVVLVAVINMVGVNVAEYLDQTPVIGWIEPGSPAEKADLQIDDEILRINNKKVKTWNEVEVAVWSKPQSKIDLEIKRGQEIIHVEMQTESRDLKYKMKMGYAGFFGKIMTQASMVVPNSPADKGGLKPGDVILAINNEPVFYFQFGKIIEENPEKELEFLIEREGEQQTVLITPKRQGSIGKIDLYHGAKSVTKKYGFFTAFVESFHYNRNLVFLVLGFIRDLATGEASASNLSGPIDIANLSYTALSMGFITLMSWIALISLQLGVINLFPIPVLDGGQILVLSIEGLFRRDFNTKVKQIIMQIGFAIFIFLIVFAILNDVVKRLPNGWDSILPF